MNVPTCPSCGLEGPSYGLHRDGCDCDPVDIIDCADRERKHQQKAIDMLVEACERALRSYVSWKDRPQSLTERMLEDAVKFARKEK